MVNWQSRCTVSSVLGSLALTAACSNSAGPGALPSCGARGTQLSLAVAQYSSFDPASDSGCVTFAANTAVDTAEYLVLPWSGGGTPGSSTPFTLKSASPPAAIAMQRFSLLWRSLSDAASRQHGALVDGFRRLLVDFARGLRCPNGPRGSTRVVTGPGHR